MRKHSARLTAALLASAVVSLSVLGTSLPAIASDGGGSGTDKPVIEALTFSAACFNNQPGAQGSVFVYVPEGGDPADVSVTYGDGEVLFGDAVSESGSVTGGKALPIGEYELEVLINGAPVASGQVRVVTCKEVANPGGMSPVDSEPIPSGDTAVGAPVAVESHVVTNVIPEGKTDGRDVQNQGVSTPILIAEGVFIVGLLAMLALFNPRHTVSARK